MVLELELNIWYYLVNDPQWNAPSVLRAYGAVEDHIESGIIYRLISYRRSSH